MTESRRPLINNYVIQWLLLCTSLLILGSFIAWHVYAEHHSIDALERERLATQAKVVNENLGRQLVATHLALDSIRDDLRYFSTQPDREERIKNRLQSMREAMPGIRAITVFDQQGTLTARSPDAFVGQNFSQRDYFQIARQGGDPEKLYVSPPFLAATGEYVINLVKILPDAHGKFDGILLASLDPGYFSVLLNSVRYAKDMSVALSDGNGKLFLMVPPQPGVEGQDLARPGSVYTRHMASGQQASVMTGTYYAIGDERVIAQHSIKPDQVPLDQPLVLAVSRSLENIFSPWRQNLYTHGSLFFLLALTSLIGLLLFQKRQHAYDRLVRQQENERKQAEAEVRIAAVAFEAQEGMVVTDAAGVVLRVNQAFTDTTGYSSADIVGQTTRLLQSGRHDAEFYRAMWESIGRTGTWQGEIWDKHKDGRVFPKWLTISAVKDAEDKVTHYIGTHFDITERKAAEEKINTLAFYDHLTKLPNRTLLLDRLSRAMASGARSNSYGALLFIDLDNFKTLNDTQGHDTGDLLLKQVADRLRQSIREEDTAARQGGDEFVVVLSGLGDGAAEAASAAESLATKLLAELGQPYPFGPLNHHSTASIGVALFKGHTASIDDLMKQADLAMYRAKESGRNMVRFFDPAIETAVKIRADLESDLRKGINENQLLLHYQPQVVSDGRVTGAEVLVRWLHPQRGMVSPADFIPLAEETDLILPLGRWVMETACRSLAAWAEQPALAALSIAVNVSAKQFRKHDFVDQVLAIVKQTGANPHRLKLELTESLLVHDVEEIIEKMHILKAKGVGFSLDDFGTGYSSLSYLKRLPLDQLKIDQSFVRDVLSDPNDAAIAKTIVALAQSLGLAVIAEGVETAEQRDFLANSGCHAYQGYFFSRPLPLDGFNQYVLRTDSCT